MMRELIRGACDTTNLERLFGTVDRNGDGFVDEARRLFRAALSHI